MEVEDLRIFADYGTANSLGEEWCIKKTKVKRKESEAERRSELQNEESSS